MRPHALRIGLVVLALLSFAPPAEATFTATTTSGYMLFGGDEASDSLTVTVTTSVLEHDRFGVDPGFASAQDFDTTQAGTQSLPSTSATALRIEGGGGQDAMRLVDGRAANPTEWLHAGQAAPCVQDLSVGVTGLCYQGFEAVTLDGGSGDDRLASLDGPAGTLLTLAGGEGDDSLSQDGEDRVHRLESPVALVGGPGSDETALTEDQPGAASYVIGDGQITGPGYAPVSFDESAEFVTVYTRLSPNTKVTITETSPRYISVWSAGGSIDSRKAGPQTEVLARPSLFELDDQGPINFRGGPADDILLGTDGNDVAKGGGGTDQLNGEGGRDRMNARDGKRDVIDCGTARDRVKVDRREASLRGCEVVKRPR